MRILMLTQWFHPEPDFKGLPFAKELVRMGHTVEVLTGFPNYPGGRLYEGYRVRLLKRETLDGIHVIRVPLYPSHDGSSVRRILNYASFALAATLLGPLFVRNADVMYVYHAPASIALPAATIRFLRGIRFVYDINDLWPDSIEASGMLQNEFVLKCIDLWCRLTYRIADAIVVNSPGTRGKLSERGVPQAKVELVYNWCDEAQLAPDVVHDADIAPPPEMAGRFNVVFAGTMGKVQALDSVLDAALLLKERCPAVQFVFVGGGVAVEQLREKARRDSISNALFLPRRPVSEIAPVLQAADVLLVHLKDDPLFRITIPSKTQAYMSFGRPILMAVRGDAAELVEKAGAGIACSPEDPGKIAEAVMNLYNLPIEQREALGEKGRRFYASELSIKAGARRFERIFDAIAGT